jgi:hypothetical protein
MPRYEAARQAGLFRLSMLLAKPVDQLPAGTASLRRTAENRTVAAGG